MNSKEIRSKISKLLTEQQAIALAGFTADSRAKFDAIQKDVDSLEADAARLESYEARAAADRSFTPVARPNAVGAGADKSPEEQRKAINTAFQDYARRNWSGMRPENRDLLTTSDATGGAFIPQLFSGVLVDALKFYGPVAQKVEQKITANNGAPLKVSYDNDTANGLTLLGTEGTSSPAETDPTLVSHILGVDTVTGGLVKVSLQELEDSSFDLDSFIRSKFSIRYARGLEQIVTNGKDSAGTTLPNSSTGGLNGMATVSGTTVSLAAGIGWDDLTTAFAALDPAYIGPNTAWVMNSGTRGYLLGLKDGFGRPYFTPDPVSGKAFAQLLGYDVVLNQSMPNMGANATPILFGDLQRSYMLRTDGEPSILRLNERYADTLEVGFYLYSRVGGLTKNAGVSPIVSIKQAAD